MLNSEKPNDAPVRQGLGSKGDVLHRDRFLRDSVLILDREVQRSASSTLRKAVKPRSIALDWNSHRLLRLFQGIVERSGALRCAAGKVLLRPLLDRLGGHRAALACDLFPIRRSKKIIVGMADAVAASRAGKLFRIDLHKLEAEVQEPAPPS